ncbi:uncharacterized protein [Scyliorhinus torazame]|uniref:uncharacterized protein n=1 Tax=Scyliorhinus torazame TaxID=75743 RepID=UPI003B5AE22E
MVEELETVSRAEAEASGIMLSDGVGSSTTVAFQERNTIIQRDQSSKRLEELLNNLLILVHKINSGHITISKEMIAKAQRLYRFPDGLTKPAEDYTEPEEMNPVEKLAFDSAEISGNIEEQRTVLSFAKEELSASESFAMSTPPYNEDITEILLSPPLVNKLKDLKNALLKNHHGDKTESCDNQLDPIPLNDQSLIPADLGNLSPHHFVLYRFGCYISTLLCSSCGHSPLTLLLADSIPTEVSPRCQNSTYRNSFYYDANNRMLYIKSTWLDNTGGFIVSILHIMTHIKAGIQINDGHPTFIEEFERAVATLGITLFLMCSDTHEAEERKDAEDSENWNKTKHIPSLESMFNDLIRIKVPPETKFMEEILNGRLKKYTFFKLHGALQQILKPPGVSRRFSMQEGRSVAGNKPCTETESEVKVEDLAEANTQTRIDELEDEVDKMNEHLALGTIKVSEYKQQVEHLEEELRIQANLAEEPGEGCESPLEDFGKLLENLSRARDMLSMLHLQRGCVLNRLTELESELAELHTALENNPSGT